MTTALLLAVLTLATLATLAVLDRRPRLAGRVMRQPEPPRDVALIYPSGYRIPVECVYTGRRDGLHVWRAVGIYRDVHRYGAQLSIDYLPPSTAVELSTMDTPE